MYILGHNIGTDEFVSAFFIKRGAIMKKIQVNIPNHEYEIILERGSLYHIHDFIDTQRKIFILTDQNIPAKWVDALLQQCPHASVCRVKPGEESKSFQTYEYVLKEMLAQHMTRKDLLIALGGGVIGDLGGFVSASYMRGIDFISIPTTTLSQIDSSIGGKTAINVGDVKNIVGAFHHPKKVIIDFDTLSTLDDRQVKNGLVEAIKAGLIHDASLFEIFKQEDYMDHLETIIYKSLMMKKKVVEQDEKENGLRKTLNFGHTIGHGIEAYYHLDKYLHGECVAMGMLFFLEDAQVKQEVLTIYQRMGFIIDQDYNPQAVFNLCTMDKKAYQDYISIVKVKEVGKSYIEEVPISYLKEIIQGGLYEK